LLIGTVIAPVSRGTFFVSLRWFEQQNRPEVRLDLSEGDEAA
jgi:hypothetical protein